MGFLKNHRPLYDLYPYSDWKKYASTTTELDNLFKIFHSLPKEWIEWIEERVENAIKRNIVINNPLDYRMSILENGIIFLQEAKYICDLCENVLRQMIFSHIAQYELTFEYFSNLRIYEWGATLRKYERDYDYVVIDTDIIEDDFIMTLSFSQITAIISRGWKPNHWNRKNIVGYGSFFFNDSRCREYIRFEKDMKYMKGKRNMIAHSKQLFSQENVQVMFEIANLWLSPLGVNVPEKVLQYRKHRPHFLKELLID